VKGNYHFTRSGLLNANEHGITPDEVWQMLNSMSRVFRSLDEDDDRSRVVIGVTETNRFIVVLVRESTDDELEGWDIVAARDLPEEQISVYEGLLRRQL
jgi:uncharacterized DUF497 family protein